jgi:uncharacterized protein
MNETAVSGQSLMILVRIILFGLLIYMGIKVISRVMRLLGSTREVKPVDAPQRGPEAREMVRDPLCGVYVSAVDAVSLNRRGGTVYFCSDECRRRYIESKG